MHKRTKILLDMSKIDQLAINFVSAKFFFLLVLLISAFIDFLFCSSLLFSCIDFEVHGKVLNSIILSFE